MPEPAPWSPAAFEERYVSSADPWSFATSRYELARYSSIVGALRPEPHRYRLGYEPACSVGVLTALLAARCDVLVATDVSASAVRHARKRCGRRAGLSVSVGSVQDGLPAGGHPDLVVFSELGYYFTEAELGVVVERLGTDVAPGGDLVACHWTGESADHRLSGATVHDVLHRTLAPMAAPTRSEVHEGYLLDTWRFGVTGAPWAVSVVVPALDEAATIRRCVRSILVAGSAGTIDIDLDVTVVADRCRDRTAAAALEALEGRGRVVEIDVGSVGAGRRIGADLALKALAGRGHPLERTWLLATDADSTVPPDWVTAHLSHAQAGAHAVAGIVVVDSFRDHHASVETAFHGRYEIGASGEHRHVHGTNLGVRGDAYRAVGGWRDIATGEDHDLWRRLQRSGAPLVSTIAAPVRTSGRAFGRAPQGFAHLLRSLAPSGGADDLAR